MTPTLPELQAAFADIHKLWATNFMMVHCDTVKAALQAQIAVLEAGDGWLSIDSAPMQEPSTFLVLHENEDTGQCVTQVSVFERNLYPDNKGASIDWMDRIDNATHWRPLPAPPALADGA